MARPLVLAIWGTEALAEAVAAAVGGDAVVLGTKIFPDGESYVRLPCPVDGRPVALAARLHWPNSKMMPLLFAADAARELGADGVGLIAPYLPYMRQDARFLDGEAITSATFARLVSGAFDWLVTVDPHLHRRAELSEIYAIPSLACEAAPVVGAWIGAQVGNPIVIGPDAESRQWASAIAEAAGAPFVTLEKSRRGDTAVDIAFPDMSAWAGRTPVLVDDIIASGTTMEVALHELSRLGFSGSIVVGVHGILAVTGDVEKRLTAAGATRIAVTTTVRGPLSRINVDGIVAEAAAGFLDRPSPRRRAHGGFGG